MIMLAWLTAAVLTSSVTAPPAPVGPDLPAGTNAAFQRTAVSLQTHLEKGEWAAATRVSLRLPNRAITLTWDDSAVPSDLRAAYRASRDKAIEAWTDRFRGISITLQPQGAVNIGFTKRLPVSADSVGPAGAAFIFSDDAQDARVEAVISLQRGAQGWPTTPRDVRNEVAYTIGTALGLERTPRAGGVMDRHDFPYTMDTAILPSYLRIATEVLDVSDQLRVAVSKKTRLAPPRPQARLDVTTLSPADAVQGDIAVSSFGITNVGNAPLRFDVVPDCGCFSVVTARELAAGQSTIIQVRADTAEFPGPFAKAIYVMSNDADRPVRRIPVKFYVEPRFRFLTPSAPPIWMVPDEGLKTDIFLSVSLRKPFAIKSVEATGAGAVVEFEPWSGNLPDPELKEGSRARKGYRLRVLTAPDMPLGRIPLTITVQTDDPSLGLIRETLTLQRGIIALPGTLFLGEVGTSPVRAWVMLNRPGKPFRITAATTDHPNLRTSIEPVPGRAEVRVVVHYDGKGDSGDLSAILTVKTDDPRQPEIRVPIRGTIL